MEIRTLESLAGIDAADWNALHDGANPFVRHEFLHGLELTGCLEPQGWYPMHLAAFEEDRLVAALPLYLRDNSYGEFVFDWSWADAYERAGGRYYPKLVSAIPFTPATGPRFLTGSGCAAATADELEALLANAALTVMNKVKASSWHCLFPTTDVTERLAGNERLLRRQGCQYHWFNRGYTCFDEFLASLSARKRKEIRRERSKVAATDVAIEVLRGADITEACWHDYYAFYRSTFERRWGAPRLNEEFFNYLSAAMPEQTVLLMASRGGRHIAGAFALQGTDTLFGRHWGCSEHVPLLHFELCYYRTIDLCISEQLRCLDAGAQGEHKVKRGFEPVSTWSLHGLAERGFHDAIARFLVEEDRYIDEHRDFMLEHSAYRADLVPAPALPGAAAPPAPPGTLAGADAERPRDFDA